MPRCSMCEVPASSAELLEAGPNKELACANCRRPKPMEDEMENKIVKAEKKTMFSLNVSQVQTRDGASDYLIEAGIKSGALNFQLEATVDQIREFFTERREKAEKAKNQLK
jgi:hypothetical protein